MAKEDEFVQLRQKSCELEKENSELTSSLAKREQELEARNQEKEDLERNLERTKEKLELEIQRANEVRMRLAEMESQGGNAGVGQGVQQGKGDNLFYIMDVKLILYFILW